MHTLHFVRMNIAKKNAHKLIADTMLGLGFVRFFIEYDSRYELHRNISAVWVYVAVCILWAALFNFSPQH
jgi:hypothetical protein